PTTPTPPRRPGWPTACTTPSDSTRTSTPTASAPPATAATSTRCAGEVAWSWGVPGIPLITLLGTQMKRFKWVSVRFRVERAAGSNGWTWSWTTRRWLQTRRGPGRWCSAAWRTAWWRCLPTRTRRSCLTFSACSPRGATTPGATPPQECRLRRTQLRRRGSGPRRRARPGSARWWPTRHCARGPGAPHRGCSLRLRVGLPVHVPSRMGDFVRFGPDRPELGNTRFWLGNHYASRWADAADVADEVLARWEPLWHATTAWTDVLDGLD